MERIILASIRYVFAEQPNVDWASKTSFPKAKHNVRELKEKTNFQNDNLLQVTKILLKKLNPQNKN